ncbi:MAG: DUF3617 family protein [Burkholderiales bacterium]
MLLRCLAMLALAAGASCVASAQDFPSFRRGMWELSRTIDDGSGKPQVLSTKKCSDPTSDMRQQNAMLSKAGCTFSPTTRSGASYSFTAQCSMQGTSTQSKSVITPDGDSAYKVEVESRTGGKPSKELLVAKRVGDC